MGSQTTQTLRVNGIAGHGRDMAGHPVASLLDDVAAGRFPAPDGSVTILPQPSPRYAGVFAFTAHSVVFADADPAWIRGQLPPGDLAAPILPAFLQALAGQTMRRVAVTICSASPPRSRGRRRSSSAG